MLHQHTITQLQALRLEGMALGLQEQFTQRASSDLSFEERFGLLVCATGDKAVERASLV